MSNNGYVFQPTYFLDTNAIHYVNSYLRHAQELKLPPFSENQISYQDVRKYLNRKIPEGIVNGLMNGAKLLAFFERKVDELKKQTKNEEEKIQNKISVYISRLSKAEIYFGVFDGQAHARMAKEGIPYRMRQSLKLVGKLVLQYLEENLYEKLCSEIDEGFDNFLVKNNIDVEYAEDNYDNSPLIINFSQLLQKNVFIGVIDCWLYACAVAVQAETFFTSDEEFSYVINRLRNPQNEKKWIIVSEKLKKMVKTAHPVKIKRPRILLPEAKYLNRLKKAVPKPWII